MAKSDKTKSNEPYFEEVIIDAPENETPEEREARLKRAKKRAFWDKITTGLLLLVFAAPFLILLYIVLWFLMK